MHNALKKLGILFIVILAVFCFATKTKASIIQPVYTGFINPPCIYSGNLTFGSSGGCGIGTDTGINQSIPIVVIASSTGAGLSTVQQNEYLSIHFGSFASISSISVSLINTYSANITTTAQVFCDGSGSHNSDSSIIPMGYSDVTFNWSSPVIQCNDGAYYIQFQVGGDDHLGGVDYKYVSMAGLSGNTDKYFMLGASGTVNNSYAPKIAVNASFVASSTAVSFSNPPFVSGLITPNFKNWQVCVNTPTSFNGDIAVTYGTSTPDSPYIDDLATNLGLTNVPITNGNCFVIAKSATSTPGNYQAQAILFNSSNVSIATSSILTFTITAGEVVEYPNQEAGLIAIPGCSSTDFKIDFFGGEVDFGKGLCNVARFLFVPDQAVLNNFGNLRTTLQTKAPFSYFYDATNALDLSSVTSTPMGILTLHIGSSSTPIYLTPTLLSTTTLTTYTDSTSRSAVRTLMQWALYIMFLAMVISTVKSLFNGNSEPTGLH